MYRARSHAEDYQKDPNAIFQVSVRVRYSCVCIGQQYFRHSLTFRMQGFQVPQGPKLLSIHNTGNT